MKRNSESAPLQTRKQKLNFIKDLMNGKASLNDYALEPITGMQVIHNGEVALEFGMRDGKHYAIDYEQTKPLNHGSTEKKFVLPAGAKL